MWLGLRGRQRIGALEEQFAGLETAQKSLVKEFKSIQFEWESQLDKMVKVTARLNARIRAASATENDEEQVGDGQPPPMERPVIGSHAFLVAARAKRRH